MEHIKLHHYQKEILKKLTLHSFLRFNDLLIKGLESEHMNYHLKKLLQLNFVERFQEGYALTDLGKDYTNLLDDNVEIVEKQPKVSVLLYGKRLNITTGEIEFLLYKRLKHPYYGKVGRLGGKVRFGETFEEAAQRELFEETGLTAGRMELEEIYHKLRKREDGTFVQDVIFYIFFAADFSGTFIEKTDIQENFWISKKELSKRKDLDFFDDFTLEEHFEPKPLRFGEHIAVAEGF